MSEDMQLCSLNPINRLRQVGNYLRHAPGARSISYLILTAASLETVWRVGKPTGPYRALYLHLPALPLIAALTYTYVRLRPEDYARWNRIPLGQGLRQMVGGAGLGAGAFMAWLAVAVSQQWATAPKWGWEATPVTSVMYSVVLLGIGHLALVWNEEMIFRGYGFDTVQATIGPVAAVVMVPLFALYHGLNPQQLLGMAAGGTTLMLLRLHSGGIWLPIGYHWMWNFLQTAIYGPPDAAPSLRPLAIHGPYHWVGRPGLPEPGLLSTLIQLLVAVLVILWMRRSSTVRKRAPA